MSDIGIAGGLTLDLMTRALDAAALRHAAYAKNVANAGIPGYQPLRVSFEDQLSLVRGDILGRGNAENVQRALANIEPRVEQSEPTSESTDTKIPLDMEVANMMQNAVWYQSLLTALNKSNGILRLAIRGGSN
jgi:flagellar basal-body rod protein FlgB